VNVRLALAFIILLIGIVPIPLQSQVPTLNNSLPLSLPHPGNITLANVYSPSGVNPYSSHSSEPAPMGIADYGLSPNGPFIRTTTQFLGKIYLNSLSAESSLNTPCVSFQLNVVLNYEYDGNTYALWVQDVAYYNTQTDNIEFEDAIYNFSAPNANVTGVSGNGGIYGSAYLYTAYNYPGSPAQLSLPTSIYLLVNVTTNYLGQPVIYFWYNDGYGWINYDTVTVTNVFNAANVYFLVDGYQYTPSGNFYDAELIMGGPGGGSSAYVYSSDVFFALKYWNGQNFQEIRNAYNFGADTAETVNNVNASTYYFGFSGGLVSGLMAGSGTLGELWTQDSTATLIVDTGISSGRILVYNSSYSYSSSYSSAIPFYNGEAELTLVPMNYSILVYNSDGQLVGEANANLTWGEVYTTGVTQFSISAPSSVSIHEFQSVSIPITINAYGNVKFFVNATPGISYSLQNPVFVNGTGTIPLTLTANVPPGVYIISVEAELFPGFFSNTSIVFQVTYPLCTVNFNYNVIGQSPSSSPTVTLDFPNGTIITLYLPFTLNVPPNTQYSIQEIISGGNGIRWATPDETNGIISSSENVEVTYYEQFLVTFTYTVQGGQGYGEPTVSYDYFGQQNYVSPTATVWVDANSGYSYPTMLPNSNSQERWITFEPSGLVSSPGTIGVYYYNQYYITVNSPLPVYALVNGVNSTLTSGWYNESTDIQVENLTYYPSLGERYVITSMNPSSLTVESPAAITILTITQYYITVNSPLPVYALVNGTNTSLRSGWYNANSIIQVENITYYPTQGERYVITSMNVSSLTVNGPSGVSVSAIRQYYVTVEANVRIYALVNSTNTSLRTGWYNAGTTIKVENITQYPIRGERVLIVNVSPSSLTVNSPTKMKVDTLTQYYVNVSSIIPVKAIVNGTEQYLNSSWINANTTVEVVNYTYYVNNVTRYVIAGVTPWNFTLMSPRSISVSAEKQYLVKVGGVSSWHDEGSYVTLNANVPFYEVGKFVGTYNVSPGSSVQVNGPINEELVESLNIPVTGLILAVVILAIALGVVIAKMVKKKE